MSLLQNLLKSLQQNITNFEAALLESGDGTLPHLYEAKQYDLLDNENQSPPWAAVSLIDKIRVDLRAMEAIVTPTRKVHLNNIFLENKSAALSAAASLGLTDAIINLGGKATLKEIAKSVDVNEQKLGRLLRLLAGDFVYREAAPDVFTNTRHSMGLLKETKIHYFLQLSAREGAIASTGLYENLIERQSKNSYNGRDAPFCKTVSKSNKAFMDYVMDPENADVLQCVSEGVVPWLNRTTRSSLLLDYPWAELGTARVIDVGCGPGDCAIDLLEMYPKLQWVFQDLPPMIEILQKSFPASLSHKVDSGEVSFQVQDYFQPNIAKGDVWFLRGIIREYDDEEAINVLRNIAAAMKEVKGSRMILNEVLCSSPTIIDEKNPLAVPSKYLPEQQSTYYETANLITWNTYALFGGKERSFYETKAVLERAGLTITRFFKFRTFTTMIECAVNNAPHLFYVQGAASKHRKSKEMTRVLLTLQEVTKLTIYNMNEDWQETKPFQPAASILREMLVDPEKLILCPGVYDGFTARIALSAGFEGLYMTGAGTAASVLGQADLGLIALPEMATNAGMIASLDRNVPVIADADTGFGSSLSIARAVKTYIQYNVAAIHIEDQTFNKRCGHLRNKELVSLDEYLVRIRAAARAREESGRDIVLIARTDSLQSLGLKEAICRLKAAYKAGADVAFLEGFLTKEQCREACRQLAPIPCLLNVVSGGVTPAMDAQEARNLGFKIVIWPVISLAYAYSAVKKAMHELKEKTYVQPTPNGEGGIKDIFGVCGIEEAAAFDGAVGGSSLEGGFFS